MTFLNTSKEKAIVFISREFLYRTYYFFLCFFFSFIVSWVYGKEILYLYLYPITVLSQNIIFTSISEAFTTRLELSIWVSLVYTIPIGLYLCFCFLLPSGFPDETIFFYKAFGYIFFSFIVGIFFCSVYIIPGLCFWFLNYSVSAPFLELSLEAKVSSYFSWTGKIYFGVFWVLQMPILFLIVVNRIKDTKKLLLAQNRPYIHFFLLLVCAIISPPDFYSQFFLFSFCGIIFECILWHRFFQETLAFYRKTKYMKLQQP